MASGNGIKRMAEGKTIPSSNAPSGSMIRTHLFDVDPQHAGCLLAGVDPLTGRFSGQTNQSSGFEGVVC